MKNLKSFNEHESLEPKETAGTDHLVTDIEKDSVDNKNFRKVIFTSNNMQLVVMSIPPKGDIGIETHKDVDQFFRVEEGEGNSVINGKEYEIKSGTAIVVPAGKEHNIINTSSSEDLKLYTVYSPPNHRMCTVHKTKEAAEEDDEKFDGSTNVAA